MSLNKIKSLRSTTACVILSSILLGSACGSDSSNQKKSETDPATPSTAPLNPMSSSSSSSSSSSGQTATNECDPTEQEQALVDAHNTARSEARRCGSVAYDTAGPVTWNCKLGTIARAHSADMARVDFLSHTGSNGLGMTNRINNVGYNYRNIGENIAAGQQNVNAVLNAWLTSTDHCKNIMNPAFTEIGSSAATSDNSTYGIYWTTNFGRPL